jgi:hypothetical protein
MKDRTPTEVLSNGAVRYGIYDASGALQRYEYILPADEPTQEGTPLNKANLLSDTTAAALGLTGDPTVNDALAGLITRMNRSARRAYGSYVGTGTYGSANPTSITFDFQPDIVFITPVTSSSSYTNVWFIRPSTTADFYYSGLSDYKQTITWNGNTLSFYITKSAAGQLNTSGATYYYIAFGTMED